MNFVLSDIPHGTSSGKTASFYMNSLAYFQIKTKGQFWRKFVKSGERSCTNPNSGGTFVPLYIVGPYDLGLPRPHIAIRPQLQLHQVGRISDGVLRLRRGSNFWKGREVLDKSGKIEKFSCKCLYFHFKLS